MRLLVHTCCGPCACYPFSWLAEQGHDSTAFFFNPNIHPYQEFERRAQGVAALADQRGMPVIWAKQYDLDDFLRQVVFREEQRCRICFHIRLLRTAQVARRGKFDAFTTTLLVSPRQKHDWLRSAGEQAAAATGVPFFYRDFRPHYRETTAQSLALGLYRQSYCGCIYSERDRYAPREKSRAYD